MRILDGAHISYETLSYEDDGEHELAKGAAELEETALVCCTFGADCRVLMVLEVPFGPCELSIKSCRDEQAPSIPVATHTAIKADFFTC